MARIEIGEKFGRLTVIGKTFSVVGKKNPRNASASYCVCDCNADRTLTVLDDNLKRNHTKSCGCLQKENKINKHGMSDTAIYAVWSTMKARCSNPNVESYERYGGRGITVCQRWLDSFENFWEDMGPTYKKGLSIERINNDGNYEPSNCRWANYLQQSSNKGISKNNKTGISGISTRVFKNKTINYAICIGCGKYTYNNDFFEACCIRKSYELNRGNNG